MKVLVADKLEQSGLDGLTSMGCEVFNEPELTPERLGARASEIGASVVIVRSKKVPAAAIMAMGGGGGGGGGGEDGEGGGVKLIIRAGAGYDNIDCAAAKGQGIGVANCPGMNAIAVAELTMAHLLNLDRRIVEQTIDAKGGKWNKKGYGKTGLGGALGLKGATLGVVGCGAIGRAVIKRALAFEMKVIAWSRSITKEHAGDLGAMWGGNDTPSLLEMAGRCDAISIHLPGAPDTKRLIGAEFFAAMRKGAYLINTSRGSVVDEGALREAMKSKGLRAGMDVFENQPPEPESAWTCSIADLPGVSLSHHSGASTDQAQVAVVEEVVRIVEVFRTRGQIENRVA